MPEEASTPPVQDQASTEESFHDVDLSPPSEGISQEWLQDREKQMQSAFTQKTQALADQRKGYEEIGLTDDLASALRDPNTRDQALVDWLEQQGWIEDDEDYDEPEDFSELFDDEDSDPMSERIQELEARLDQREQAEILEGLESHLHSLLEDSEVKVSDRMFRSLMRESLEAGPRPSTTEKVFKEWVEDYKEMRQSAIDEYRGSKDAPAPPASKGGSGSPEIPVHDAKARRKLMAQLADQAYASG